MGVHVAEACRRWGRGSANENRDALARIIGNGVIRNILSNTSSNKLSPKPKPAARIPAAQTVNLRLKAVQP